jgi:hypothetical protein
MRPWPGATERANRDPRGQAFIQEPGTAPNVYFTYETNKAAYKA